MRKLAGEAESTIGELRGLLANITVALVVAHIFGVAVASVVHKENLVLAMITGRKRRAALDEPVFILRAQDKLAPRVVVWWAHLADQAGYSEDKVRGALILAKQMVDWRAIRELQH